MSSIHITRKEENEKCIVEIDHSVTWLLKCTKGLLETLTDWSIQSEHKDKIYEQFNSLQHHFEKVCHAFYAVNLSMDDLLHIPHDLKQCLDAALSQAPSDLEYHLPSIRDIILQLLQGLKKKQALLHDKARSTRSSPKMDTSSSANNTPSPARNLTSSTSSTSGEFDMMDPNTRQAFTQLHDDGDLASRSSVRRGSALDSNTVESDKNSSAPNILASFDTPQVPSTTATVIQPPARRRRAFPTSPSQPTLSNPTSPPPSQRMSSTTPSSPTSIEHSTRTVFVAPKAIAPFTATAASLDSKQVLFLQWRNRTKRVVVSQPIEHVSQLMDLFRCTFSDASMDDGSTKISILDNDANIMYELDDITLVRNNTLLSLDDSVTYSNELMQMIQQAFQTQFNQWAKLSSIQNTKSSDTTRTTALDTSLGCGSHSKSTTTNDQQALIDQLKMDFERLQKAIVEHQTNNDRMRTQLTEYEHQQTIRQDTNAIQSQLQERGQDLTTRLETLQDTIDDMKQDVTQRRCRPSPNQLEHCHKESSAIQEMIRSLGGHINRSKPVWKKAWEEQLQRIVGEQQSVKEYEHLVADFEEDHTAIVTVLEHLTKVSELQKRQSTTQQCKPIVVADDDSGGKEGMDHVLQQLQTIDVDHEKRLDALAQAEKRRARDMANRIDDFEKELITFVDTNKLKKTGGAEQLERQQEQKTRQLLMDLYDKPVNT